MLEYPFIVGRYDESSPTHVTQAREYILDSAIGDETVGNEDVLDRADNIGASIVVAADVKGDTQTTTDRIVEMCKLVEQRDREYEVLVPLQFDDDREIRHHDHYEAVRRVFDEHGWDIDDYRLYIGGVNNKSIAEQIQRCIELREHVGIETYVHGLGIGANREWIVTIRKCPWLLDSLDNSSIVQNLVMSDKLWTADADWISFPRPRGNNSTVVSVQYREASLDLFNYMISTDIREEDAISEYADVDPSLVERVEEHRRWYFDQSAERAIASAD